MEATPSRDVVFTPPISPLYRKLRSSIRSAQCRLVSTAGSLELLKKRYRPSRVMKGSMA